MQKNVQFQIEDAIEIPSWVEDYPEHKFTVFKCCFLSTKRNSHELEITDKVLKECASTILGNFLVAKLMYGDATTHKKDEIIFGYFPACQKVEFVEEENIVKAYAYAVVSKRYSKDFNNIFEFDNLRNSSVEMTVETPEDDEHSVLSFDIFGLTVLGKTVNGSCPDADIQMVRFAKEEAEVYLQKSVQEREISMEQNEYNREASTEKAEELAVIEQFEDSKGKEEIKMNEEISLSEETVEVKEELAEDNANKEDEAKETEMEEQVEDSENKSEENEDESKEEADMACGKKEEMSSEEAEDGSEETAMSAEEMSAKIAELEKQVEEKENIIMEKDKCLAEKDGEINSLKAFKAEVETKQQATAVEKILSEVAKFMDKNTIEEYRKEGLSVEFAQLDGWANKVKALALDKVVKNDKGDGVFRFASPVEKSKSTNIWDRL